MRTQLESLRLAERKARTRFIEAHSRMIRCPSQANCEDYDAAAEAYRIAEDALVLAEQLERQGGREG